MTWFWILLPVVVIFAASFVDAAWKDWTQNGWAKKVEEKASELGMPPITHRKRRFGRTVGLMATDPSGKPLWKAERVNGETEAAAYESRYLEQ